ncbi:MAG: LPS export ABC transporter permease LptF [Gammaproteobacteria bacterium]|nr:LPS export ABC transporter permease LptF [Gammaproteobacteria bacterium]
MLKQTIIDRYIGKEILLSWIAVFIVLTLIISGSTLGNLLSKASEGDLPNNVIFTLLSNAVVRHSITLFPVSLFIGALFAFGRLYKDSEMVSMFACGVTIKSLYRPLIIIAIPMSLVAVLANLFLVPGLTHEYYELGDAVRKRVDVTGIVAGRFTASKGANPNVFFMERRDEQGKMHNTFLYQYDNTGRNSIETAASARHIEDKEGHRFMVFNNGLRYEGKPGDADYRSIEYKKHGVYIEDTETTKGWISRKELPTSDLWLSDKIAYKTELQWRFAVPIVILVLAFIAVPFSYTTPRKGRFTKMGPAIILYIAYSNLLIVASSWMEKGKSPEWIGLWWVHLLFILFGLIILMKQNRWHKRIFRTL